MSTDPSVKTNRTIFRPDAIERYVQRGEQSVLPRFVSPRTFAFLWALLALLAASGFLAWFAQVPVYASGLAVVVDAGHLALDAYDNLVLALFLPPENRSQLQVGQSFFLRLTPAGEPYEGTIFAIEHEIIGPAAAQQKFGLGAGAAQAITGPAAVALARLPDIPAGASPEAYLGSVYRADVQLGSRRALSLLPLVGRFFE